MELHARTIEIAGRWWPCTHTIGPPQGCRVWLETGHQLSLIWGRGAMGTWPTTVEAALLNRHGEWVWEDQVRGRLTEADLATLLTQLVEGS